jgi:ParB family chromosome partitioning protein
MSEDGNKRLGRGLSALLGEEAEDYAALDRLRASKEVPVEHLQPNPFQPRHRFDETEMQALVESVKDKGILQPILVRRLEGEGSHYQIIAGERRWRAAQAAKLHNVPVVIREFSDEDALEIALVENLQRQDLSPIEEAAGFKRLMDEFSLTQEKVSARVGKSRSHVANMLRLLNLPEEVREMLDDGRLSAGHARALVSADEPLSLARQIVAGGFNVRQAEKLSRRQKGAAPARKKDEKDADTLALEGDLSAALGLKVTIHYHGDEGGDIRIAYKTLEQLDEVCRRLCHQSDEQDEELDLDTDLDDIGFGTAFAETGESGDSGDGADTGDEDVEARKSSDPATHSDAGPDEPVSDGDLVFGDDQDGNNEDEAPDSGEPDPTNITGMAHGHTTH